MSKNSMITLLPRIKIKTKKNLKSYCHNSFTIEREENTREIFYIYNFISK